MAIKFIRNISTRILFTFFLSFPISGLTAELEELKSLFSQNYNAFYEPRFCGRNIERLVKEASSRHIDLDGAFILKIEGTGFLETSGFYTRTSPNKREALGHFHVILVVENQVFDFDLLGPLVLSLEDYVRLQFTPPKEPITIFGVNYESHKELKWWKVTRFEINEFAQVEPHATWTRNLGEYLDLDQIMSLPRTH